MARDRARRVKAARGKATRGKARRVQAPLRDLRPRALGLARREPRLAHPTRARRPTRPQHVHDSHVARRLRQAHDVPEHYCSLRS
jgi:hypothetical protein